MNDYRVRMYNYDMGEILEMEFDALYDARTYQKGAKDVLEFLSISAKHCDTAIEHRIEHNIEQWERVPDEDDIIDPE